MTIAEMQNQMISQLKRRGFYPIAETDTLLRLGEEVGELFEAVREKKPQIELERETADILWMLLILCDAKKINLGEAFLEKLSYNETRPLQP